MRPAALSAERQAAKDIQRERKAAARQQKIEERKQRAAALLEKIEERKLATAALLETMAERQRKATAAAKSKLATAAERRRQTPKRQESAHSRTRGNVVARRRAVAVAAAGLLATGALAFTLAPGSEPTQSQTPIRNAELGLRMPSGWQRTSPGEARFGSLSSTLGATPAGAKDTVLQTGLIVEPQDTTQALRRALPAGGEAVTTRLGRLEAARYAPRPDGARPHWQRLCPDHHRRLRPDPLRGVGRGRPERAPCVCAGGVDRDAQGRTRAFSSRW